MTTFAPFIARNWLSSATLSFGTIQTCLILAAWTIPSQLLCNLHVGVLTGLERQISANLVLVLTGLGRALLIVFAVLCISADARTFFAAQCAALAAGAVLSGILVWCETPAGVGRPVKPRFGIFVEAWRFNSLLIANAAAFVVATQSDKMLASGLLALSVFGHYTLAATIASMPSVAVSALTMVLFPRFARLIATGQNIRPLYHLSSQAVSIFLLPVWALVFFFPQALVMLWTGDAAAAAESSLVLPMLVSASVLLTLNSVPNAVVLTGGWPQYPLIANVASLVSLPFAYWLTPRYGVLGPTFIPLALGILNFILAPLLLGRRMLRSEQTRWFMVDVGLPLLVSALGGLTLNWLMPAAQTRLWTFVQLSVAWSVLSLLAISVAPNLRAEAIALARQILSRSRRGVRAQEP
jgi:O-antigen/teichoic acid export membrane protein